MVVTGHVDHGKSTLVGRMLYESNNLGDGELSQLESEAKSRDKKESKFAFALDRFEEERDKLVTIDTRSKQIGIKGRTYNFADAPGHRKWIRNVIMGSMFADAQLLVVRADRGPEPQTREHSWISKRLFGIDQAVIAIEMMDIVDYSEEKFKEIKKEIEELFETVDHIPEDRTFVPVAAYRGENISEPSTKMGWWDGPTLFDALERFEPDLPDPKKKPRFMVLESFRDIRRDSVLASGIMTQGSIQLDDRIKFLPNSKKVDITAIEDMGDEKEQLKPGERATIVIDDSSSETDDIFVEDIQRGYFAVKENDNLGKVGYMASELYLCKNQVEEGDEVNVWVYGNTVSAKIQSIENVRDVETGEEKKGNDMRLGDIAKVEIKLEDPVVLESIDENRNNSMFMILDGELAIGYGNATEVYVNG